MQSANRGWTQVSRLAPLLNAPVLDSNNYFYNFNDVTAFPHEDDCYIHSCSHCLGRSWWRIQLCDWSLFFAWNSDGETPTVDEEAKAFENMTDEQKLAKAEQEKEDKKKKEEFLRE